MDESMYDRTMVQPMAEELNAVKVRSLQSADEVDAALAEAKGTTLVVVNSVCGCAAGNARPGVAKALQHSTIPDDLVTVFAGVDRSATDRARTYMKGVAPSSPCIALFKQGQLVAMMERRHIEGITADQVAEHLTKAFDEHCTAAGPSIPAEEYANLAFVQRCGSSIPPNPMRPF